MREHTSVFLSLLLFAICLAGGGFTAAAQESPAGASTGGRFLSGESGDKAATELSRDSILVGDQVKWSMALTLKEGEDFFIEQPDEPVTQGIETISPFRVDTLKSRRGLLKVEGSMVITSFDSGSFFLPPLIAMIQRSDGSVDTLYYDGPTLEVGTIPVDTATFEPYDIKGQFKYPLSFSEVAPWVGAAIVLAAIIWVIVRYVSRKRKNLDFFGRQKEKEPAHIVALKALEKIRSAKLWENDKQKQFYSEVTDTIRQYIADNYGISAMEETSAQMLEQLKATDVEASQFERLKDIFTTADFVKFAKHTASTEENEEVIPSAVSFVNATYLQKLAKEEAARASKSAQSSGTAQSSGAAQSSGVSSQYAASQQKKSSEEK